jgi:hypothetical protein
VFPTAPTAAPKSKPKQTNKKRLITIEHLSTFRKPLFFPEVSSLLKTPPAQTV